MSSTFSFSRRDFFRTMGLSASAAAVACTRAPVKEVIPFLVQPEELTPGVATWYASTCRACPASCGTLLKTRDGRPIKVEGNDIHPLSRGGLCAAGQASVLSLYDAKRAKNPVSAGKDVPWKELDSTVKGALRRLSEAKKTIVLVTPPALGPTGEKVIADFLGAFPTAKRVSLEDADALAIASAHQRTHGVRLVPAYHFDRAKVIASFGADFLGTWLSPVAYTRAYVEKRNPEESKRMSRHFQVEPILSLTGASADVRWTMAPRDTLPVLAALAARLGAAPGVDLGKAETLDSSRIDRLARELESNRGECLVVSGSDDLRAQMLVNSINHALGSYGSTITVDDGLLLPDAAGPDALLTELKDPAVGAAIFVGTNPVYSHPEGAALAEVIGKIELTVATNDRPDETAKLVQHLAPDHHALESWGDTEPARGVLGLLQPAVAPLYDTRSALESLLVWANKNRKIYEYLKSRWQNEVFPKAIDAPLVFDSFWDRSVHDGVARTSVEPLAAQSFVPESIQQAFAERPFDRGARGFELVLYPSHALRDGALGNNAWLHELPDPITKVTWCNPAQIAPSTASSLGLVEGDMITISAGDRRIELPVVIQPGTHPNVVGVALGYGRTATGPIGDGVGANASPLAALGDGRSSRVRLGTSLQRAIGKVELAKTQIQGTEEDRDLVEVVDLDHLVQNPDEIRKNDLKHEKASSMWPKHEYTGHRWGMAIDLSKCTGCSGCVVACQAENNVPSVGAEEVRRGREMHWLRIDRYFSGPTDEPEVHQQPMGCMHCENAPCETVCPVLATVHSSEGLSQQVYNRCVGTRYCANNCPTKARRFNWFEYPHEPTERLVLNPDVVVRTRGVMEKCSFCVQRIQAAKQQARAEGREVADGEVRPACAQSCPGGAIVFGDLNDPNSKVSQLAKSGRSYRILGNLNLGPAVSYLARVTNTGSKT